MGKMWLICWVSIGRCVLRNGKVHFSMRQFLPDTDAVARMSPFSDHPGPMHLSATSSYGPCSYTPGTGNLYDSPAPTEQSQNTEASEMPLRIGSDRVLRNMYNLLVHVRAAAGINIQGYNHIKFAAGHICLHTELQCTRSAKGTMRE